MLGRSSAFSPIELAVFADLWRRGSDNEPELEEVLTEESRQTIRTYLKGAVPHLTNDSDPRGELRGHLALAISRVGDPEDVSDIVVLMASDVERIELGSPHARGANKLR